MVKVPRQNTPCKGRLESARATTPEQWETAFSYLRKHRHDPHKWRNARSMVPGVALNTLKSRFKANRSEFTRKGPPPVLGADVEKAIKEFLLPQADVGNAFPIDLLPAKVRDIARGLFGTAGTGSFVGGKDWQARFHSRHPELSVRMGQLAEVTRLNCLSREAVDRFYSIAELALKGVQPANVWFMDESGIAARGAQIKVGLPNPYPPNPSPPNDTPDSPVGLRTPWSSFCRHPEVGDHKARHSRRVRVSRRASCRPRTHL